MSHELQRKARTRKAIYLGTILGLFTLSLLWRGVIPLPFVNVAAAAAREKNFEPPTLADRIGRLPVLAQADHLELRELDIGDPNIAASAAQYSLLGFRGPIVTGLWWAAIEKQKRNEWHEFEQLVRVVTHLQPNFITPWIFQSWNIAYNVSVENDKLGDMYFYIARGIELLAEGDRLNTKTYRPRSGEPIRIGSPDIRYQVGFYYQNKFGVSDKVNTLRSLMQLSCIKPAERNPDLLLQPNGDVDMNRFREFCERNPQLVRRLRTKLNCSNPKDIIDFLRANSRVPTRYLPSGELANEEDQFPIFPQEFSTQEYNSRSETTDSFDAFHAARGWFEYAQIVVPPPPKDEPAAAPSPNEYDTRLYRLPQRPALVIFRMAPPRAQSYLAERLTKEGWFTQDTVWDPDSGSDTVWFSSSATPVRLKATISAQAEWDKAYLMWRNYGTQNVLLPDSTELLRIKELSAMANAAFPMGERPRPAREYSDEEIDVLFPNRGGSQTDDERRALARQIINARRADVHFQQNSQITNFQYFLATSEAEKSPALVEARRLLWDADLLRLGADRKASLRLAVQSMVRWREVCQQFPRYHNNDSIQEQMVEAENSIVSSLKPEFTAQVEELRAARLALKALAPVAPEVDAGDALQALAENEAALRMADATRNDLLANRVQDVTVALTGAVGGWVPTVAEAELPGSVRRGLIEGEFAWMKQYTTDAKTTPWIRSTVRDTVKQRLGLSKPPETTTTTAPEGKPKPTLQTLPN